MRPLLSLWTASRTLLAGHGPTFLPEGYRRIYHAHIRKTAGTSINQTFLSLLDGDGEESYRRLTVAPDHRIVRFDGKTVVGWNLALIEGGRYFYGFSHAPLHSLSLPPGTFTFTALRDPVDRVVSHYRMLVEMRDAGSKHPAMAVEGRWLGRRFSDFLDRIPAEHLCAQLWMFSPRFHPVEAAERILKLDAILGVDTLAEDLKSLAQRLELSLPPRHVRKSSSPFVLENADEERLREMLAAEYEWLALV